MNEKLKYFKVRQDIFSGMGDNVVDTNYYKLTRGRICDILKIKSVYELRPFYFETEHVINGILIIAYEKYLKIVVKGNPDTSMRYNENQLEALINDRILEPLESYEVIGYEFGLL